MAKTATAKPEVTAIDVLGPVLRQQVQDLRSWEPGVRLERAQAVHRYRIAARRLRSNLAGFRAVLDADTSAELGSDLRDAAAAASGARDAETVRRHVEALLRDESDPSVGATRERLDRLLSEAKGRAWQDSVRHLDAPEYDAFTRRLERFADLPPWTQAAEGPAEEVFRPLLRQEWARFREQGRAAVTGTSGPHRDDLLHGARKASKRARYLSETLVPVFGRRASSLAEAAERIQVVLGEYQDCAITQTWLGTAGEVAFRDGENNFVLGRMQAREATTAHELRETYVRLFLVADRRQLRRWMQGGGG